MKKQIDCLSSEKGKLEQKMEERLKQIRLLVTGKFLFSHTTEVGEIQYGGDLADTERLGQYPQGVHPLTGRKTR